MNAIQILIVNRQMTHVYDEDSVTDVGIDLRNGSNSTIKVKSGGTAEIPTGINVRFGRTEYIGLILPEYRETSIGHFIKQTAVGESQEDEIVVSIRNDSETWLHIKPHDRIAQLVFTKIERKFEFIEKY